LNPFYPAIRPYSASSLLCSSRFCQLQPSSSAHISFLSFPFPSYKFGDYGQQQQNQWKDARISICIEIVTHEMAHQVICRLLSSIFNQISLLWVADRETCRMLKLIIFSCFSTSCSQINTGRSIIVTWWSRFKIKSRMTSRKSGPAEYPSATRASLITVVLVQTSPPQQSQTQVSIPLALQVIMQEIPFLFHAP